MRARGAGGAAAATATAAALVASAVIGSSPSTEARGPAPPAGDRCAQPGPYDLPRGGEPVDLDPADFTTRIDHPYWPMKVGTVWRYVERGGGDVQTVKVTVTPRTRLVAGIRARVVHDVVREDGRVVENTHDWYAQDRGGSLWYLGESTAEYDDGGLVSTEGSWEHGVDGAQAGVVLPASPRVGCRYREEYKPGEAEDRALVLGRTETIDTPTGRHRRVLHTANTTPLEPGLLENKLYAAGIGPVVEIDLSPDWSRAELVRIRRP